MRIYEIDEQIAALIDPETGEVKDFNLLTELKIERDKKVESLACYYKDLQGDAQKICDEIDRLKARLESTRKSAESIKNYLSTICAGQQYKTARYNLGWRKSTSVVIDNEALLPIEYIRQKVTTDVDRMALKAALSEGATIKGAHLENTLNIQIK